jgi:hypothetical protein
MSEFGTRIKPEQAAKHAKAGEIIQRVDRRGEPLGNPLMVFGATQSETYRNTPYHELSATLRREQFDVLIVAELEVGRKRFEVKLPTFHLSRREKVVAIGDLDYLAPGLSQLFS